MSGSASITVLTPTLPERSGMLEECKESVNAQSIPVKHLVYVDEEKLGPQRIRNKLANEATTEFIIPLDDDDTIDPECIEVLLRDSEGYDIIYPWCRMVGRTDTWVPNRLFNAKTLARRNFIPVTALIKKDMWEIVGGQRQEQLEDWMFYQRVYLHGARFKCVPEVLWSYRFHDSNQFQYQR